MPEAWTGQVVGMMHNADITYAELAEEMGISKGYLSMILTSYRTPKDAQSKVKAALDTIIERRGKAKTIKEDV